MHVCSLGDAPASSQIDFPAGMLLNSIGSFDDSLLHLNDFRVNCVTSWIGSGA